MDPRIRKTALIRVETMTNLLASDRTVAERELRHPWFGEVLDEERFFDEPKPGPAEAVLRRTILVAYTLLVFGGLTFVLLTT